MKESKARQLAKRIARTDETSASPKEIDTWDTEDVYAFIEAWDYQWNGKDWVKINERNGSS